MYKTGRWDDGCTECNWRRETPDRPENRASSGTPPPDARGNRFSLKFLLLQQNVEYGIPRGHIKNYSKNFSKGRNIWRWFNKASLIIVFTIKQCSIITWKLHVRKKRRWNLWESGWYLRVAEYYFRCSHSSVRATQNYPSIHGKHVFCAVDAARDKLFSMYRFHSLCIRRVVLDHS